MVENKQTGYEKSSPDSLNKESNEVLRDITGTPLNPAEIKQLSKIFNTLPEGLQNLVNGEALDEEAPEIKTAQPNISPDTSAPQNTSPMDAMEQLQTKINEGAALFENMTEDNYDDEALNEVARSIDKTTNEITNEAVETLKEQQRFNHGEDKESPEEDNSINHDKHAFAALATSQEALRVHRYLDEKDQRGTLAGKGDEKDDDPRNIIAKQMAAEMMLSNLSNSLNNFADNILNHDTLSDEERAELELQIVGWEKEIVALEIKREPIQTEYDAIQKRMEGYTKELSSLQEEIEGVKVSVDSLSQITKNIEQDRAEKFQNLGPASKEYHESRTELLDEFFDTNTGGGLYTNIEIQKNEDRTNTIIINGEPAGDKVSQETQDRFITANTTINEIWDGIGLSKDALDMVEKYKIDTESKLEKLESRSKELHDLMEKDGTRSEELKSQLAEIDNQVIELREKIDHAQTTLDIDSFVKRKDIQGLATKMKDDSLPLEKRQEYAQQILDEAETFDKENGSNIKMHLLEEHPDAFAAQNNEQAIEAKQNLENSAVIAAEAETNLKDIKGDFMDQALHEIQSALGFDTADHHATAIKMAEESLQKATQAHTTAENTMQKINDTASTGLNSFASEIHNTSRTGTSAASADNNGIPLENSLSETHAHAGQPRNVALDVQQPAPDNTGAPAPDDPNNKTMSVST